MNKNLTKLKKYIIENKKIFSIHSDTFIVIKNLMLKIKIFWLMMSVFINSVFPFIKSEKINISFGDSTNFVLSFFMSFNEKINNFMYMKDQKYIIDSDIFSENDDFYFRLDLSSSGYIQNNLDPKNDKKSNINTYIDTELYDKIKKQKKAFVLNISNLSLSGTYFTKISNLSVDIGKGNSEGNLLNLIGNSLSDKWIKHDFDKGKKIIEIINSIKTIIQAPSTTNIFVLDRQLSYAGDIAYKVTIRSDILEYINSKSSIKIKNLESILIVKGKNNIQRKIINMETYGLYDLKISGLIGQKEGQLSIFDNNKNKFKNGNAIDFSYKIKKKYIKFSIINSQNYIQKWGLDLYISEKMDKNIYKIDGDIKISPILIYGTDLENEIKININSVYEKTHEKNIKKIKEPDNYILLDQILGDDFSVKNLIGNN